MITVLIRCSDDYRVLKCIESIKSTSPKTPIVVSMTPNKKLEKNIINASVNHCVVPRHNAAITNNKGISLVKTEKIIVTDADTIFEKNSISLLEKALSKYDAVKPRLVFWSETKRQYFSPVANLRTFFNDNEKKMYIPGVSFSLKIRDKIGSYIFDEKIPWGEDSDFSDRVVQNGLKTKVVKKAILYHPSVEMTHDLADACLIGSKKQGNNFGIKIVLKRIRFYRKLLYEYGIPTLFYGFLWYLFFDVGKTTRSLKPLRGKLELFSWAVLSRKKQNE